MNESEKQLKEKLLLDLIAKMSDGMGDRMKPKKEVSVEVSADKHHIGDALEKAKSLLAAKGEESPLEESKESADEESDEDRLRALMSAAGDDEDEEDKRHF